MLVEVFRVGVLLTAASFEMLLKTDGQMMTDLQCRIQMGTWVFTKEFFPLFCMFETFC